MMQPAVCQSCGGPLIWHNAHRKWFCQQCGLLIPPQSSGRDELDDIFDQLDRDFNPTPPPIYYCQTCRSPLTWVQQYGRWFCHTCNNYV